MKPVGLDNYVAALTDPIFRDSFLHVLGYIAATLVLEVGLGLALAGIVSARRGTVWFRVAFFAPVMLPMVVVAILWSFVYNGDFGLLNATLGAVGLAPLQRIWLGDTSTALLAVSVVSGWVYAGFYMTIFYAAIRQIPHEVLEAARMDGAGEWALFRRIKVPMIRNALAIAVLLCVTGGFQGFDLFFVLTNGGPYGATEIPTTYLVKVVFRDGDVGYGSAMAVILTAIVLGIGFVYVRLTRRAPAQRRGGEPVPAETAAPFPAPAGIAIGPGGTA
jgi:raffinose/stachyose/melibiose transport system permease protein